MSNLNSSDLNNQGIERQLNWRMIMKRVGVLLLAAMAMGGWALAGDTYKVDPVHSSTVFRVGHAGIGTIYGTFNEAKGQFTLDKNDASKSSFDVAIVANSVNTHVEKRDAHLKSPDFLNVKQYPLITFKSTSVKKVGDGKLEVTGDLTLHGVTKQVMLPVDIVGVGQFPPGTARAGVETTFTVKQSDYEIKGVPGATSDEIKLMVAFEGTR